jgi:hypothetical protein
MAAASRWILAGSNGGRGMTHYKIGDHVGFVDLVSDAAPLETPLPKRWFILRVHHNREDRVMRAFHQRSICAYLPLYVRTIDRKHTRRQARKPHLGRRIVSPLIPGLIFIPDFEFDSRYVTIKGVDDVAGFLQFGDFLASLSTTDFATIRAIEAHLAIPAVSVNIASATRCALSMVRLAISSASSIALTQEADSRSSLMPLSAASR